MGPNYSDQLVEDLYNRILILLKEEGIQSPISVGILCDWQSERDLRNSELKEAVRRLVELDSWENW